MSVVADPVGDLLVVRDLQAGYGQVQVLQGVSFTVGAGEIVVVLGANGAGKTTTMRAISGMVSARGSVCLRGRELVGMRTEAIARLGIAHVPQGRGTFAELTVEENLRAGALTRRDKEIAADISRWFDLFPRLAERRSQQAGSMSGGEQQMLAVARALMLRPTLLLLDEPSLGLAPLVTKELFDQLAALNRETGLAMLIVEQNASLSLEVAARGYVLEAGEIAASGSAHELATNDEVRRAYLGM